MQSGADAGGQSTYPPMDVAPPPGDHTPEHEPPSRVPAGSSEHEPPVHGPGSPVPPSRPRWGLGDALIGMGLFFLVQIGAGVALAVVLLATGALGDGDELLGTDDTTILVLIAAPLGWVALIGWPWWVSRRKGFGSMARDFGLGMRPMDILLGLGGGVLCVMAAAGVSLLYMAISGDDPPTNTDIITSDPSQPLLFIALLLVIAGGTPIAEEIFFRGLVMGAARRRWGTAMSVVFSSALFGLFHVQGDPLSWAFVAFVTGSYGVVFAMMRVWSDGRLGSAIVAHMIVNAFAVVVVTFG